MLLDGAATVETWDKSGELLHLRGMDISSFQEMQAPVDWEHWSEKHAQGQFHEEGEDKPDAADVVGRVIYAKKIYGPDDCADARQRYYWDKVRLPYLYVRYRLFDDAGHQGAGEVAAIIRSCKLNNEPLLVGLSVGGATMQRGPTAQGPELLATIARSMALTCRPCNAACNTDVLEDQLGKREARLGGWTTLEVMDPEVPQDLLKDEAKLPKIPALKLPGSPTLTPLTQRGKPLPAGGADEIHFDEQKGVLHTPRGSIPAYLPKQDGTEEHFHNILSTPGVEAAHGKAMEGWTRAHRLLREHRLPPEVVMHGVLFSHLSPNCVDAETEALTQRGWVKGFELSRDDVLLTKNPDTGALEWQGMTDLRLFPDYAGPVVEFQSRSFHAVTTPDHRWLVTTQRGHVREKTSVTMTVPGDKIHRTGDYRPAGPSGLTPDEAEVLGWFVTDGYYGHGKVSEERDPKYASRTKYAQPGVYACVCQSTTGNPDKCARIDALMARVSDEVTARVDGDGKKIWRLGPRLTALMLARSPARALTVASLLDLDRPALERLREAMGLGDGHRWQGREGWAKKECLVTGRREQAEAFQILLTLTGSASAVVWRDMSKYTPRSAKMANIPKMTGCWVVTALQRKVVQLSAQHKTETTRKVGVWCPVVPNTFFVARRDGSVYVTGNTPVSVQEEMYSYLMDAMKHTGHDARSPGFKSTLEHWHRRNPKRSWGIMPKHSREHFETDQPIRTKAGTIQGYALGEQKGVSMGRYHAMHDALTEIVGRHGRDARGAARELLGHKIAGGNWENRRKNAIKRGQPDIGEYQGGPHMAGLAPKTTRYALGMMGGGNIMVPDTHFIRHFYGMENVKDTDTIDHLKTVLNNEQNSHVLEGMDRWYAANHPAVRFMLQHSWKHHFQAPEDAIFPAFWRHWMAIAPHEQARGMRTFENNQLTTHRPYWDAIEQHLKSEGLSTLPLRTAQLHRAYVREHGEVPALLLYLGHLLPQLLDEAGRREGRAQGTAILAGLHPRLEAAAQDLRGAAYGRGWADAPKVFAVDSREGARLGRVMMLNGRLHHLEDYRGLLGRVLPEGPLDDGAVARLDALRASPHVSVTEDRPPAIEEQADTVEPNPANGTAAQPELQSEPTSAEEGGVATYLYRRAGMDQDHVLEVSGDAAYLDGRPLPVAVARLMLRNARNGAATLKPAGLAKAGEGDPMDINSAMQHMRAAVTAGHLSPEVAQAFTQHVYGDSMVPGIGGKYAFNEFRAKGRPGVYIRADGNSFGQINKQFGQDAGDEAIRSFGQAARRAMDEAVGRGHGKVFRDPDQQDLFRDGGDEFAMHVPTQDHAVRFLHALRTNLDNIPPIGGRHKLSMSFGLGQNPDDAGAALVQAKAAKKASGARPGEELNYAHSLVPGRVGPLNLHSEAPPVHPEVPSGIQKLSVPASQNP